MFKKLILLLLCLQLVHFGYSQDKHLSSKKGESSLGIGFGIPYGGAGIRFGTNLVDNLEFFGGLGYMISGVGYNLGLKTDFASSNMTQFYLVGMYGTNAGIKIKGATKYNKMYTGATFGFGIKLNSRRTEGNYWDFGLLIPIRSSKFKDAKDVVKNDPWISDYTSPWPVLIAVGYNFNL